MLDKTYSPALIEGRQYNRWEASGAFACGKNAGGDPYTIVIPPPNVTGSLHMGHALNNTLQDVLIRYKRMDGYNALWVPGVDHAGIATQWVVRRQIEAEGHDFRDYGRERFLERTWDWKGQSQANITNQLKPERVTSHALRCKYVVCHCFVRTHESAGGNTRTRLTVEFR